MNTIPVSAILLSYNSIDRLRISLESYRRQDYPLKDLVVIDDCSPNCKQIADYVTKWIEENGHYFTNVKFIRNARNIGVVHSLRIASLQANGEIIFPLGQGDTCYGPQTFSLIAKSVERIRKKYTLDPYLFLGYYKTFGLNPKWHISKHSLTEECEVSSVPLMRLIRKHHRKALQCLLYDNFIGGASFVYSKSFFKQGNYPLTDDIRDIEDYPSLLYMLIKGYKIGYMDFNLRWYEHGVGVTSNPAYEERMRLTHVAITNWLHELARTDDWLKLELTKLNRSGEDPRIEFIRSLSRFYMEHILPIENYFITQRSGPAFPEDFFR